MRNHNIIPVKWDGYLVSHYICRFVIMGHIYPNTLKTSRWTKFAKQIFCLQ